MRKAIQVLCDSDMLQTLVPLLLSMGHGTARRRFSTIEWTLSAPFCLGSNQSTSITFGLLNAKGGKVSQSRANGAGKGGQTEFAAKSAFVFFVQVG
jgi:hypothetical protein